MTNAENFSIIAHYLARRDFRELSSDTVPEPADLLVLMPSGLLEPISVTADAVKRRLARKVVVSGGIGHSTQALRDIIAAHPIYSDVQTSERSEADIVRDIMVRHLNVSPELIIVENESTNCGENAEKTHDIVRKLNIPARSLILIQDPTMQRRSHAAFERAWQGIPHAEIRSFAPFIPITRQESTLKVEGSTENVWPFERFAALVLGEIMRLKDDENGYGPKGRNFIDHIEIPPEVLRAYIELTSQFKGIDRKAQT